MTGREGAHICQECVVLANDALEQARLVEAASSSASIPAGLAKGMPVGMQIIGKRYADTDVLAVSAAFERLRPWQQTYDICRRRKLS